MTQEQERALRMCKHKAKYALLSTAQKKAEQSSAKSGEKIEPYKCSMCGSWHIGHPKEYDVEAKSIEELHLAKIRDPWSNHYIFAVEIEEELKGSALEICKVGTLVAYKKGKDPFKERGGSRSKHWRNFQALYPRFIQESDFEFMQIIEAKMGQMGLIGVKPEEVPGKSEEELGAPVAEQAPLPNPSLEGPELLTRLSLEDILKKFEEMSAPDSGLTGDYVKGFVHGVLVGRK